MDGTYKCKVHADGRISFPSVVQYRVGDEILDLPPTVESHPDPERPGSLPWHEIIHDIGGYLVLSMRGWLRLGLRPHAIKDARKSVSA